MLHMILHLIEQVRSVVAAKRGVFLLAIVAAAVVVFTQNVGLLEAADQRRFLALGFQSTPGALRAGP